jgi:hypothetical protein
VQLRWTLVVEDIETGPGTGNDYRKRFLLEQAVEAIVAQGPPRRVADGPSKAARLYHPVV